VTVEFGSVLSGTASIFGAIATVIGLVNRNKIREVHVMMNSRFDEMLTLAKAASHAQGVADERANPGGVPPL
jgi:hypothetical protein